MISRWTQALVLLSTAACRAVLTSPLPPPDRDPSSAWEVVLAEVVTEDGLVDYDRLEQRRSALDQYVAWLGKDRPRLDRENTQHQLWLNAYNALVLFNVLESGRPASVQDVPGWLPWRGSGFFFERAFIVQGDPTSLFEIEHERLRGRAMDLRDHAALNCASRSCPPLRPELYRMSDLDEQLRDQMARWIDDDARGVRVEDDVAVFNPIFDWYAWDFDFLTAGDDLCTTAARFASGEKALGLTELAARGCPHRFFDYDWSLNAGAVGGERPPGSTPTPTERPRRPAGGRRR